MTRLRVKTRGGAPAEGKPRVYFTCHPADFERSFERICGDLFKAADCAVYCTEDMEDRLPEETRETDLERMNLFVVPVSLKLLLEENRAMGEDVPFAREKGIPVLPIVLEPGLEPVYGRKDRFGELQFLDPAQNDPTAVPYEEKLRKYLRAVLLDEETVRRIRKAFDAYVFLSYRKKDRKQANELMRLIHADPLCRDIAVWFDEFLTPGESFRDTIGKAMKDSRLFLLLVTPSLLETGDRGEPNFVQATEYPMARDSGMDALPAELLSETAAPTDREALFAAFGGLPDPLNVNAGAERELFLARLRAVVAGKSDADPVHNYLIGLAYLDGVDVETDRERGLRLITAAGEAELPEAMERLHRMYYDGQGVAQDYRKALQWEEKLALYRIREMGLEHPDTLRTLNYLAVVCYMTGDVRKAAKLLEKIYVMQCVIKGEAHPHTLTTLSNLSVAYGVLGDRQKAGELTKNVCAAWCALLGEEHPVALTVQNNLAVSYQELGKLQKALELQEKVYALRCKVLGEEHPDTLKTLNNLASIYGDLGDRRKALELMEKAYALCCKVLGEEHPDTLTALSNLAVTYGEQGDRRKEAELEEKVYALRCRVLGEEHPDTLTGLHNLAWTCGRLGKPKESAELFGRAAHLRKKVLGPEHPNTLSSRSGLAEALDALGEHDRALEICGEIAVSGARLPKAALDRVAGAYERNGLPKKAEALRRQTEPEE